MSSARPLAPRIAAALLLLAALSATVAVAWIRWRETRWLSAPGSSELTFAFQVDSDDRSEFLAVRRIILESFPTDFPGVDHFFWPERRCVQVLAQRPRVDDVGSWALRIGSAVNAVARARAVSVRWRMAVVAHEGVLWGPRESDTLP